MSIENTDSFGNYLIHGIDEIILPDIVSWWPSAPGWQALSVIVFLWFCYLLVRRVKRWWRDRYRREALRQLDKVQKQAGSSPNAIIATLPHYIKVTALQAYPRHDVASLTGNEWLAFLDVHYSGPTFTKGVGEKLLSIAYLPQEQWKLTDEESRTLIRMSRLWIKSHKVVAHV